MRSVATTRFALALAVASAAGVGRAQDAATTPDAGGDERTNLEGSAPGDGAPSAAPDERDERDEFDAHFADEPDPRAIAAGCDAVSVIEGPDVVVVGCRDRLVALAPGTLEVRWRADLREALRRVERGVDGAILAITPTGIASPCDDAEPVRVTAESGTCAGRVARSERDRAWVRPAPHVRLAPSEALAFFVDGAGGLERVATGTVRALVDGAAVVELGLGERVPDGALALRTRATDHSAWFPPRTGGRVLLRGALDALVPLDGAPGGLVALEAAWFLDAPVVLRAGVAPIAFGVRDTLGIFAMLGYASAGLDLEWLELSLGVAGTTINHRPRGQATSAFAPLFGVRVGAEEGASLAAQLFFTIDDVGVDLGAGRVRLTLPITRGHRLIFRADVGRHGVLRVDAGFRTYLEGAGDRGSIALGFFAGVAHVFYQRVCPIGECSRIAVLAPSVGVELDWSP
ncbi:MAG: hypothetical protein KF729_31635 [Sandaracinaceae bacterium]|nr:hypothetical protein [Sandaracinaceae bacterium]